MSGGSYEYLFTKDVGDLFGSYGAREHLERMRDRLTGLGYAQDAAQETDEIIQIMRQCEARLQVRLKRLQAVWKGVEWWDSGDSGEDGLQIDLLEYRGDLRVLWSREAGGYEVFRMVPGEGSEKVAGPLTSKEAIALLEEAAGAGAGRP